MQLLLSTLNIEQKGKIRKFSGIANSGKPFIYSGKRTIVDLASLMLSDKVPALLLHDRVARVGFGALSIENGQLKIDGTLLSNDHANAIAADADAGFPWQMSAHINAGKVVAINKGDTITINGHTIEGEIQILYDCTVPEVSFTPTGVDSHTSAIILSNKEPIMPQATTTQATTAQAATDISHLQAQVAKLTADLQSALDENAKLKAQAKKAAVEVKLSDAGFVKSDKGFVGLSDSTLELLLSADESKIDAIIIDIKPKDASFLLSEQYANDKPSEAGNPLLDNAAARAKINSYL